MGKAQIQAQPLNGHISVHYHFHWTNRSVSQDLTPRSTTQAGHSTSQAPDLSTSPPRSLSRCPPSTPPNGGRLWCWREHWSPPTAGNQWASRTATMVLDSGTSLHFTGQQSDLVDAFKLAQPLMIQMANSVTQVEEAGTVFITHTVLPRNGKVIKKTTCLQWRGDLPWKDSPDRMMLFQKMRE